MKTERNIFLAFILNLLFSIFEFIGGILTGSVAITSDSIHDMGDALSIGVSYLFEKKSKRQPDEIFTYGYARYSVLGGFVTTLILIIGSVVVIYSAIYRLFRPVEINYNGMIIFAIAGLIINTCAAYITRGGDSINQKAVNLHMLEDVLGWVVVLVGAIAIRFTGLYVIDPMMSMGVATFILINSIRNLKEMTDLFLEKIPCGLDVNEICADLSKIDGVCGVHHVHIRTTDGQNNYATMHVITDSDPQTVKSEVRRALKRYGIYHSTLETERSGEECREQSCSVKYKTYGHHHHSCHGLDTHKRKDVDANEVDS